MADTVVQRVPTGDSSTTGWYPYPSSPSSIYDKVDDSIGSHDDNTTRTNNLSSGSGTNTALFTYASLSLPSNARNIVVKIIVRARRSDDGYDVKLNGVTQIGASSYSATVVSTTTSFTNYTFTFSLNPSTGAGWTSSGANNIACFGFSGQRVTSISTTYIEVTQAYIEVTYNLKASYAASGPGIVIGAESTSVG